MAETLNTPSLSENRTTIADAWAIAADRLSAAKAALDEFDRRIWRPAFNAAANGGPDISFQISQELDRLQDEASDAEEALLALPAPDLASLLWKFERHRANVAGIWPHVDMGWDAVGADLTRLAAIEGLQP